jgi:polyisoprenoid-binding protein YceI
MKNILTLVAAVAISFSALAGGSKAPVSFKVDAKASSINWLAKKVTGEHNGTVAFSAGVVETDGKALTGGNFTVDMSSLAVLDLKDPEYNGKLKGHLSSPDFFDIAAHKTAKLVIKSVKSTGANAYDVTADLTIKGITKPITFPATVAIAGNKVTATAKVTVDRTNYDIKYGSGKFFENLGDKAILDDFVLDLNVVATK